MPEVNVEAMNEHLAEISRRVSVGAIALCDRAGWHSSPRLNVPTDIVLLPLPPDLCFCAHRRGRRHARRGLLLAGQALVDTAARKDIL